MCCCRGFPLLFFMFKESFWKLIFHHNFTQCYLLHILVSLHWIFFLLLFSSIFNRMTFSTTHSMSIWLQDFCKQTLEKWKQTCGILKGSTLSFSWMNGVEILSFVFIGNCEWELCWSFTISSQLLCSQSKQQQRAEAALARLSSWKWPGKSSFDI